MPTTYYTPHFKCLECDATFAATPHPEHGTVRSWSPMRGVYEDRPCPHQGEDPVLGPLGYKDSVSGWAVWVNKSALRHAHIDEEGCLVMDEPVKKGELIGVPV